MNIIIPIGGKGERFKNEGYTNSKPLIEIFEKPMILYILDNLNISKNDTIYIIYNTILENENFTQTIKKNYPLIHFIPLPHDTSGAAETLYLGLKGINTGISNSNKNIVLDCDTFYHEDIINIYRNSIYNNAVFYSVKENEKPIYSYIQMDKHSKIIDIKEKEKISNNANTGAYCFENIEILCKYCKYILDENIVFNNEPYTSCVINEMIQKDIIFHGIELKDISIISLGTPNRVKKYLKNTKILLFDLDGTLVDTDFIYIKVWRELLKKYNIICDKTFFDYFIKGKSDNTFMSYIDSSITPDKIVEISRVKDELFIDFLQNETGNQILINGSLNFFKENKHNKIAIVTSCNKKAAQYILQYTGLTKYVDLVIASEDCSRHKPDPQPYLKAIDYFNANKEDVFIFEDSYSGYCSAKRTNVKNICLIENSNSCSEITNTPEFKYNDYNKLNLNNVIDFYMNTNDNSVEDYTKQIRQSINTIPIKSITKDSNNLKTGYICDINSYRIDYDNGTSENIVLKICNFDNELSNTAIKLNMYENETYFYDKISHLIANTPKYFGSFKDSKKDAILLEDLNKYSGSFNINLNSNIYILLNVIKHIYDIHNTFCFETNDDIIPNMKCLKKINEISYFKELINTRYEIFETNVKYILNNNEKNIIKKIYNNIDKIYDEASCFPLSFCHGDLKSPNIFYKNDTEPIFLDWQYIHLNKGVSDIVFMLVESIEFDITTVEFVVIFYYKLQNESHSISYDTYMNDFKNALCIFPFFVCVWFNSESGDKLLDPVFPIKFMKNLMKYYTYYLQEDI
uniref:Nucleotidyl transferase domain-containing protein n=1 Tax=viral metagenome TaxID=1070528 RepID=A0A6C0JFR3_9ZZZZ